MAKFAFWGFSEVRCQKWPPGKGPALCVRSCLPLLTINTGGADESRPFVEGVRKWC
jgi:hypothetical protein